MDGLPLCDPKAFRETLEPERMYVETIFSEVVDGVTYLSWHSVHGEGAADVQASAHWLDEQHVVFWQECITRTSPLKTSPRRCTRPRSGSRRPCGRWAVRQQPNARSVRTDPHVQRSGRIVT